MKQDFHQSGIDLAKNDETVVIGTTSRLSFDDTYFNSILLFLEKKLTHRYPHPSKIRIGRINFRNSSSDGR